MKVFNIVCIILFILFAAVQYNDPDPYIWMPIYLFTALLCFLALKRKFNPVLYVIGILVYSVYAAYLFFQEDGVLSWIQLHHSESIVESMKATKPWIEDTREFFGLLILIVVLVINMVWLSGSKKRNISASQGSDATA